VVIPINPQYALNEIEKIAADALPVAVITDSSIASNYIRLKERTGLPANVIVIRSEKGNFKTTISFNEIMENGDEFFPAENHYNDHDVIELLYTHGPTGTLRGAMLTNQNLYSNAIAFLELCRLTPEDRALSCFPCLPCSRPDLRNECPAYGRGNCSDA